MELNKLVFPAPQSSYDYNVRERLDEPGDLIFIPKYKKLSSNKSFSSEESKLDSPVRRQEKKLEGYIPCLYLPYIVDGRYSNSLLIYYHGNAEDVFLSYDLLRNLKKELKVVLLYIYIMN